MLGTRALHQMGGIWPDNVPDLIPRNNCDSKSHLFVTDDATFTDAGELACEATEDQYHGPSSLRYHKNPAANLPVIDQFPRTGKIPHSEAKGMKLVPVEM